MDLFTKIVGDAKLHKNFVSVLHPYGQSERDFLSRWVDGFVDRDGKIVKEFQTTFNSSFWEFYLYAVFKNYSFKIDWSHDAPDFVLKTARHEFVIEATTANSAQGKPNEWDKPLSLFSLKNSAFFKLNKEAIIRLSNSIHSKLEKYQKDYAKLTHVKNKPFVIAVAPFEQPHFNLQYDRPIRALLYDDYMDEDEYLENPASFPNGVEVKHLGSIEKNNGSEIHLGLFNNPMMKQVSAVLFSSLATWGKLSAMTGNPYAQRKIEALWATEPEGQPILIDNSHSEYRKEEIFDGLQIFHNPYASNPLPSDIFRRPRVVQHYMNEELGEWIYEGRCDSLLYRQVFSLYNAKDNRVISTLRQNLERYL